MKRVNDSRVRFSPQHTYVKVQDGEAVIGLTDFAQEHTSRVSQVELPQSGQRLAQGHTFATVEAIKATIEIAAPVDAAVLAVNEALRRDPWLINTDPYGQGWLIRVLLTEPAQLDQLMDEATYAQSAVWDEK